MAFPEHIRTSWQTALRGGHWDWARGLLIIAALSLLPFLGLSDFNTKGEPREAVVAQTMLASGNWILPENNGGEFAYKPPMLHWAIAACSLPQGEVTEFTSRLPSALAAILAALATFRFFARRRGAQTGFIAALVFLSCSEVHRAAMNCRVDMLLTLFIILALYAVARWVEGGLRGLPLAAILWMGCGTLTKGPVAILLPCLVGAGYALLSAPSAEAGRSWKSLFRFVPIALAALALPSLWYYAAYLQGGEKFLYLVFEENVLRFLGRMPYPSHEHGTLYYVPMLLSGLLPWTLLCLLAPIGRRRLRLVKGEAEKQPLHTRIRTWWQGLDGTERFVWIAAVLIIAFYLVPKSKRGVYLLPAYPFLAYFVARLALWLKEAKPQVLRWFEWTLAALVLLGTGLYFALQADWIPAAVESVSSNGHPHYSTLDALRTATAPSYLYLAVSIALIACFYALQRLPRAVSGGLYNTLAALILIDAFVLPPVLSARSDKPLAPLIEARAKEMPVYSYINDESGMMHFFTLNFYTHNALRPFPSAEESARFNTGRGDSGLPGRGYLLTGEEDIARFREQHPGYSCRLVADFGRKSCDVRQNLLLYEVVKKAE